MEVIFQKSKNGEKTVTIDGFFLHSSYNPKKEAERFVQNLNPTFFPEIIFILEPALAYCIPFFKEKFPDSKIVAIRYTDVFKDYNKDFDCVINYFDFQKSANCNLLFENFLMRTFGEEKILSSFFCGWPPSSKIFSQSDKNVWLCIKNTTEKAKTLLITRQYFEKKWFMNSANFFQFIKNPISLKTKNPIEKNVLIIASGPSLNTSLDFIRSEQNKFFIIALSSAIKVCLKNKINPDLCISTDGGFWAGQHLKELCFQEKISLALTPESFCPKKILLKNRILPMIYDDGISFSMAKNSEIKFLHSKRNGTVSGTAMEFALEYFSENIYFFGLDLASQKGFQHAQPNELQLNSQINDFKLNSAEQKNVQSSFPSKSLEIYQEWFSQFHTNGRKIFRVIDESFKKNKLGDIIDISSKKFHEIALLSPYSSKKFEDFFEIENKVFVNKKKIKEELQKDFFSEKTKKQFAPLDFVFYRHSNNDENIMQKIEKNHKELYEKFEKHFT